jgi:hypothetical protein
MNGARAFFLSDYDGEIIIAIFGMVFWATMVLLE